MANFFGFMDVTKPGKGVNKDEEQKKGLALFGQLLWRKLWKYMKLSMLYFFVCLPTMLVLTIFGMFAFSGQAAANPENAYGWFVSSLMLAMFSTIFFAGSPAHAGFTYILRNFVRQEHAWLWSDFWGRTKQNLKQAFAVYFIDLFINCCFIIALNFYYTKLMSSSETIYVVMTVLFLVATVFYAIMHDYIWTMMVTIDLKIKNIYKNAVLFSILGLGKNILSLALRLVLFFIVFNYLHPFAAFIVYAILFLSASHLLSQVYSYPYIKKYLIDPQMQTEEETSEEIDETEEENEPEFEDLPNPDEIIMPIEPNDVASVFRRKNAEDNQSSIETEEN